METFSALLALCAGNSSVTGEFPSQRPVTRTFDVFFDLRLNKRLSKQSLGWWFETPPRSLWIHCNAQTIIFFHESLCQKSIHWVPVWLSNRQTGPHMISCYRPLSIWRHPLNRELSPTADQLDVFICSLPIFRYHRNRFVGENGHWSDTASTFYFEFLYWAWNGQRCCYQIPRKIHLRLPIPKNILGIVHQIKCTHSAPFNQLWPFY